MAPPVSRCNGAGGLVEVAVNGQPYEDDVDGRVIPAQSGFYVLARVAGSGRFVRLAVLGWVSIVSADNTLMIPVTRFGEKRKSAVLEPSGWVLVEGEAFESEEAWREWRIARDNEEAAAAASAAATSAEELARPPGEGGP